MGAVHLHFHKRTQVFLFLRSRRQLASVSNFVLPRLGLGDRLRHLAAAGGRLAKAGPSASRLAGHAAWRGCVPKKVRRGMMGSALRRWALYDDAGGVNLVNLGRGSGGGMARDRPGI